MGIKYHGLLIVFLLPALIGIASGAIYVENATVFNFSLNTTPTELNSSIDSVQPRIFTEHIDSIFDPSLTTLSLELYNSLNTVRPRIFTEHIDSILDPSLTTPSLELNNSISAVRPRIFTEHIDSILDPSLTTPSLELNNSLSAVRPRIFTEHIDSILIRQLNVTSPELNDSISKVKPRIFVESVDALWFRPFVNPSTTELIMNETSSSTNTSFETINSQNATMNASVGGDFNGTLNFTDHEFVFINSGLFTGKGFSKGNWAANIEGISYEGYWEGMLFKNSEHREIYLKGTVSGGLKGIVEGYLIESVNGSGIYDRYQAKWTISQIGNDIVFAKLDLNGTVNYGTIIEHSSEIYALQTSVEGTANGYYNGSLSIVLTHVRIDNKTNPYYGQGLSIISYASKSGSGEGWAYNKLVLPGRSELKGFFIGPLFSIFYATLDETKTPRTLSVKTERVDIGSSPTPDLNVKIWGPERVSPGQTIDYIIEYRNDGLKATTESIVYFYPDSLLSFVSASQDFSYNLQSHRVRWNLGRLPPRSSGQLFVKLKVSWGLPQGIRLNNDAYISDVEDLRSGIGKYQYTHSIPVETIILPEQLLEKTVAFGMAAFYNNSMPQLVLNNITQIGNKIIVEVDSLEADYGEKNFSGKSIYFTLDNLSVGNYTIEFKEKTLNITFANKSFSVRPFGVFVNQDGLIGELSTYKGGIDNDTLYLIPAPLNPVLPYPLFNYTNFWMSSNETIFLGIMITNNGSSERDVNISLYEPANTNIRLHQRNCSFNLTFNSSTVCFFEMNTNNTLHGVYNFSYALNYSDLLGNYTKTGTIPVGVYEINSESIDNDAISLSYISPFNDTINYTASDWVNFTNGTQSIWLPTYTNYTAKYSNFTLTEPKSPWIHVLIGAAAGGVIKGSMEYMHQSANGEQIDWGKIAKEAVIGGVGGAILVGTFGAGAPALSVIEGTAIVGGIGASIDMGLETVNQLLTPPETRRWGEVLYAGINGYVDGVMWDGLGKALTASEIVKNGVAKGMYQTGDYAKYGKFGGDFLYLRDFGKLSKATTKMTMYGKRVAFEMDVLGKLSTIYDNGMMNRVMENIYVDDYGTYSISSTDNGYASNSLFSKKDSDVDGYCNSDELMWGTNPFDANNNPWFIEDQMFKEKTFNRFSSGITVARDPNIKYGPEGFVLPGQKLNYTVEFENEGEGIAFGVYFTDILDEDLDDSTLQIGPLTRKKDGSIISPTGTYNPSIRSIIWFAGEVGSREGGYANLSINLRSDAEEGTEIINYATVYFPSVPEETRTNGIVSIVDITPPRYSNVNQSASVVTAGETVEVSAYWQDGVQINYSWLEVNESGTWQNISMQLSGKEAWSNFTIQTTHQGEACWRVHANDTAGNENVTPMLCFNVQPDITPPQSITNPSLQAAGTTWLNFTWFNPPDPDFHHVMLYLNGSFKTNIPAPQNYYNFTGLDPDTLYELGTHTVDSSGNVNETWVNATGRTLPSSGTNPIVSNPTASHEIPDDTDNEPLWGETAQLNITVTDDSGVASVTVNLTEVGGLATKPMTNIGGNIWSTTTNASAGTPPKIYNLTVNATDIFGNSNTSVTIPFRVMKNGDCNGNGVVTIGDAIRLANNVSFPGNPAYALSSPYVCEVNGNNAITIGDAIRLANNVSFPGNLVYILK